CGHPPGLAGRSGLRKDPFPISSAGSRTMRNALAIEDQAADSRLCISRLDEHGAANEEGPVIWGRSPAMAELRRRLEVLARSPLPVLIEGETGTGKSFLA